tara:strand:+ start:1210 stop:1434 length:225 start_codon:yes stop_codon:yes gene_type:complete
MTYYTPPSAQGQTVIVSYASGRDGIYMKEHDQSDGTIKWFCCDWDLYDGDFAPWNEAPEVDDEDWFTLKNAPEE